MRRRVGVLIALVALTAACSAGNKPHASSLTEVRTASCVSPSLAVSPHVVRAGQTVEITAEWFSAECHDVVVNGQSTAPDAPLGHLTLRASQGRKSWILANDVQAHGSHNSITLPVRLPAAMAAGPATIRVDGYGRSAMITVR